MRPRATRPRRSGLTITDLSTTDLRGFQSLVLAPGVPLTHPKPHWIVTKAKEAGVEIIGDIELFCRERAQDRAEIALRRDHRHERQIDDDGAHRPSLRDLWL